MKVYMKNLDDDVKRKINNNKMFWTHPSGEMIFQGFEAPVVETRIGKIQCKKTDVVREGGIVCGSTLCYELLDK